MSGGPELAALRVLTALLKARTGQTLRADRLWRIELSLRPVLQRHGLADLAALVPALASVPNPALLSDVIAAMLNNETFFFREHGVFDVVSGDMLEQIRAAKAATRTITIWHCGVSTGQEAYSTAMGFAEDTQRWSGWRVHIIGTDVSETAINRARVGIYSQFEVQRGLAASRLVRWFDKVPDGWLVNGNLRRRVDFSVQNFLEDAPPLPEAADIIMCRNVLLYFDADTRRQAFAKLAAACAPHGFLVLGAGETVMGQTDDFVISPRCRGFYERPKPARAAA